MMPANGVVREERQRVAGPAPVAVPEILAPSDPDDK